MDPSARKIVGEFLSLWQQRIRLEERMNGLRVSMEVLGIRVDPCYGYTDRFETRYAERKPFREVSLGKACLTVLADYHDISLDKNQMEFFLLLGGYPFNAKDPTNSVEVTLRKLASDGKCEVEKGSGPSGNRYRYLAKKDNDLDDSDSRATKT